MLRDVGAVFAGMFIGGLANMGVLMLSWVIWPLPAGFDMNDPVALKAYVATMPVAALLVVILAHLSQAFLGGWIAARISVDRSMVVAMIVGALSLLGGILNMFNIGGPAWMWIEMPLYLVASWAAATLELKRRG